ncbi:MAG: xanthine dehydrogenase family protein molybdopterin-binding subunit, partial [Bacillota bacterium]
MKNIGAPLDRIDGPLKVCGAARYSAEVALPRMAHAVLVQSTIPNGRITRIEGAAAERVPGIIAVLTHKNAMKLPQGGRAAVQPPHGRVLSLLQDDKVHYTGQPVAVVVAESPEQAQQAAAMLRIDYARVPAVLDFAAARPQAYSPGKVLDMAADSRRGDVAAGLAQAAHRKTLVYTTPMEHHNPMEPHATL